MKATDILRVEHENILQVINFLQNIYLKYREGKIIDYNQLKMVLNFFRVYADLNHHEKEERLLFPQMLAAGFPSNNSPISVMLNEHELGRSLVGNMEKALDYKGENRDLFFQNAMEYCLFLQQHISKENMILFQLADSILDNTQQHDMLEKFKKITEHVISDTFIQNTLDPLKKMLASTIKPQTI